MNRIPKKLVAASTPLRFLVGPDAKEYSIHASLVALQSEKLGDMVNSCSKDPAFHSVSWNDIDEQSFISFWEFAYTGDYDVADATFTGDTDSSASLNTDSSSNENDLKTCGDHVAETTYLKTPKHKKCPAAATLLHHARVCTLADRYGISRLMNLAIHKLGTVVKNYTTDEAKSQGIMALLKFCYVALAPERLKRLATLYASDNFRHLWKRQEFQELLDNHATLSKTMLELLVAGPDRDMSSGDNESDGCG